MSEGKGRRRRSEAAAATARAEDAERLLGRVVAGALPAVCVTAAVIVGFVASVGSALLVLASGALLGTIALLWTSVRTLSGDAPLPSDLTLLMARRHGVDALAERKRRVLRALKDLESEHAIGKIDDADYDVMVARYREDAKTLMRDMDLRVAPARAGAERMAREYLAARGLAPAQGGGVAEPVTKKPDRMACASCDTSNEADATFCKQCGASMREASDATP